MVWKSGHSRTSTSAHKSWARAVLKRDRYCRLTYQRCTGLATEADHIVPVGEGGSEFDVDNGQGACRSCHSQKTSAEALRGKTRRNGKRPPRPHPSSVSRGRAS